MKTDIDLGSKGPECAPCSTPSQSEKYYPTLHLDCGSELAGLPDEGEVVLRYKITSRTTSERDGKKTCSVTLEAREIVGVESESESEAPSKRAAAEAALDALSKLVEDED